LVSHITGRTKTEDENRVPRRIYGHLGQDVAGRDGLGMLQALICRETVKITIFSWINVVNPSSLGHAMA
jgi:hypothetical protein